MIIAKIKTFIRQDWFFKLGFLPTWCLLGIARAMVLTTKFRVVARYLGNHQGISVYTPLLTDPQLRRARQISGLITTTSRYCPWKANCFAQAIVARFWLGLFKIPLMLYFGLAKKDGEILAHAWVCSGRWYVTGGSSFGQYTVVASYSYGFEVDNTLIKE